MAARAMWKGIVQVGENSVPVRFYSGVAGGGVHFRLLHASDNVPVSQQMVDEETGKPVPREDVKKGYEVDEGTYVVLNPSDVADAVPKSSRDVHVSTFLPTHAIAPAWFKRPYVLGPDGDEEMYFALASALQESQRVGLAKWVMRNKAYNGALICHQGALVMMTLHHAEEVLALKGDVADSSKELDAKELKLALQLVTALEGTFEPETFHDEYRERVTKLVHAKAQGRSIPLRKPKAKSPAKSLEDALRSSLKAAKENHVA